MFSRGYATGHVPKDPMPLIGKSRVSCPGGRFPPTTRSDFRFLESSCAEQEVVKRL